MTAEGGVLKKQRCVGRFCTEQSEIGSLINGGEPSESSQRPITLRLSSSVSLLPTAPPVTGGFNDSVTADVILSLIPDQLFGSILESPNSADDSEIQVCLHSHALARSKYFSTLLSDRSGSGKSSNIQRLKLHVPATAESLNLHLTVLKLLYADDLLSSIQSVKTALCLLPVALGLLFEDCIKACVKFLEAVPWTEEEEKQVLSLIPRMSHDQSKELLERISPGKNNSSEEMLHGLVFSAMNKYPNMCFAKAFLAKLLKDFPCKESARRVLHNAFEKSLKVVKQSLEEYSSPHFRGDHNETEALQG